MARTLFGTDGIRGVAGEYPLDPKTVHSVGIALGDWATAPLVAIKMASGTTFEIRHPEMILVGRTSVRVHTVGEGEPGNGSRWHDVSLMLMETLEPIEPAASSQSQGTQ